MQGRVVVVGSANLDLVTVTPTLPLPGETLLALSYAELPGGKGSNQATAAARLGAQVSFVGRRGADAAGDRLRSALADEGVDVQHFGLAEGPTGRALVMVDEAAENSIIVVQGTNALVTPATVAEAAALLAAAQVVVCQLEVPVDAVLAAARATAGSFVLNPAPAQRLPAELLSAVDVLVVNETEYETVLGSPLPDDLADLATVAARPGMPATIVATLGARGAALCHGGTVTVLAPPKVTVVDTTGAGDTFVGALAAELAAGLELPQAVRHAVTAASLSTRTLGATQGMPRRDEVMAVAPQSPEPVTSPPRGFQQAGTPAEA